MIVLTCPTADDHALTNAAPFSSAESNDMRRNTVSPEPRAGFHKKNPTYSLPPDQLCSPEVQRAVVEPIVKSRQGFFFFFFFFLFFLVRFCF